jgi:hypothetical protein
MIHGTNLFPLNLGRSVDANTAPSDPQTVTVPDVDAWAVDVILAYPGADDVGVRVVGPTGLPLLPANAEERQAEEAFLTGVGSAIPVRFPIGRTIDGDLTMEAFNQSSNAERVVVLVTVAPTPPPGFRAPQPDGVTQ